MSCPPSNAVVLHFLQKMPMRYLVKGLLVVYLSFGGPVFAKTALGIRQDFVVGDMLHHSTVYNVFAEFAEDKFEGYWSS